MKKQCALAVLLASSLVLTACAKQESAPAESDASTVVASETAEVITPEQQAEIDAIDQPVLDEKNTDVPASVANAPADVASSEEQ